MLLIHQSILYIHLFSFAFAITIVLREDLRFIVAGIIDFQSLNKVSYYLQGLLGLLWLSGIALIAIKPGLNVEQIATNTKILCKLVVVSILTLNALCLHRFVFPHFDNKLKNTRKSVNYIASMSCIFGAISTVSWLLAAFVGAAKIIPAAITFYSFIYWYALLLIVAVLVSYILIRPRIHKLFTQVMQPQTRNHNS